MASKKYRALEIDCLKMEDRMMLEEEIEMLKAIIAEKEELQCSCSDRLELCKRKMQEKELIQNPEGVDKYGVDSSGDELELMRKAADSDSDIGSEEGVSDGELEWLEKEIGTMIAKEDPQAHTLEMLTDVQSQLGNVRVKKNAYTPLEVTSDSFWRMKRLLASVEEDYNSSEDPDYDPDSPLLETDVESEERDEDDNEELELLGLVANAEGGEDKKVDIALKTKKWKEKARLVKEENRKLKAICNRVKKEYLESVEELKVLKAKDRKQRQEISEMKRQKVKVKNMRNSFEEERTDLTNLRDKFEEEAKKAKSLAAKHKHFLEMLSGKIECPVCLEVPRDGPVPVCPNGHFVCKKCKKTTCPSCRVGMGTGKSLLATTVLENLDHRCKFDECEEFFALDKLDDHEKVCRHRTVLCAYAGCTELVPLSKMAQHLSSSKACCTSAGPLVTAVSSLVVVPGYFLKPKDFEREKFCYPLHWYSLDGYDLCFFPEKDGANFYFSCVMFSSEAVSSKFKIQMTVHAKRSLRNSGVSFQFCGKPSSIDEDYNEVKHYGLVVGAKAMAKISKMGDDEFYVSVSLKKL